MGGARGETAGNAGGERPRHREHGGDGLGHGSGGSVHRTRCQRSRVKPRGRGDGGGNSLTPANPWSATRGTHARGVPTPSATGLSLQQGWATVQRERTIRMQAEQV